MDSQVPNKAALEWVKAGHLFPEKVQVTPEKTYGNSRFDLFAVSDRRKAFIEVKGVTLENNNIARFPDAPTTRGIKHVEELIRCMEDGYEAYLLLVIQMQGITRFEPNWDTHREFGEVLQKAKKQVCIFWHMTVRCSHMAWKLKIRCQCVWKQIKTMHVANWRKRNDR